MIKYPNLVMVLIGVAIGVAGTVFASRVLARHLPPIVLGSDRGEVVGGRVLSEERKPDRLLMTVVSDQGAVLVTVTKKIEEIELLIDRGDSVSLLLPSYKPFVQDPTITAVRKDVRLECGCEQAPAAGQSEPGPEERQSPEPAADSSRAIIPERPPHEEPSAAGDTSGVGRDTTRHDGGRG